MIIVFVVLPKQSFSKIIYTDERINKIVDSLVPHIEAETGMKFNKFINIKIYNKKKLYTHIINENRKLYRGLLDAQKIKNIKILLRRAAYFGSKNYIALYSLTTHDIIININNLNRLFIQMNLDEVEQQSLFKLILLHEMIHAIDDQNFNIIEKFLSVNNIDSFQAYSALIEGHAEFVIKKLYKKLKMTHVYSKYIRRFNSFLGIFTKTERTQSSYCNFIYEKGKDFFEYIETERNGITETVLGRLFNNPPKTTLHILKPRSYLKQNLKPLYNLVSIFKEVDQFFPIETWVREDNDIAGLALRMAFKNAFDEEKVSEIVDYFMRGIVVSFRSKSDQVIDISIIECDTNTGASVFFDAYIKLYDKRIEEIEKNPFTMIEQLSKKNISIPYSEKSYYLEYKQSSTMLNPVKYNLILSKINNFVVEISMSNYDWGPMFYLSFTNYLLKRIMLVSSNNGTSK